MITDETIQGVDSHNVPAWYWAAAIAALLFEALGCYLYLVEVRMSAQDIAALPLDQGAVLAARPAWYYAAYGTAVWLGLTGTVGLLLRRRWAVPLLLVSLIAVLVQFSSVFLVPAMRAVTPSDALLLPVVIIILCYGIFMLSRLARRRGWR